MATSSCRSVGIQAIRTQHALQHPMAPANEAPLSDIRSKAQPHGPEVRAGPHEQGTVEAGDEQVQYRILTVDARTEKQRERNERQRQLDGHIMVVVPGHGQTVNGPKKVVASAALLSRSKIAWCIDPVPASGGDRTDAKAIAGIVRARIHALFPVTGSQDGLGARHVRATLIGWSHGAGEALWAAAEDPELFPQVLALCSTNLVERPLRELFASFFLEAVRILSSSLRWRRWSYLWDGWRVVLNFFGGQILDLWKGRSLRSLIDDLRWAGRKALGPGFDYPGEIALLFGSRDTVIRWQDVFPQCTQPAEICASLQTFRGENCPLASRLVVAIFEGNHLTVESEAPRVLDLGLRLLAQREGPSEDKIESDLSAFTASIP